MRLVDFAHTEAASTTDENYLFGLKTLVEILEDIVREGRTTTHVYENQRCAAPGAMEASLLLLPPPTPSLRQCGGGVVTGASRLATGGGSTLKWGVLTRVRACVRLGGGGGGGAAGAVRCCTGTVGRAWWARIGRCGRTPRGRPSYAPTPARAGPSSSDPAPTQR